MEVANAEAAKLGLAVLFHEKPFQGINGSGIWELSEKLTPPTPRLQDLSLGGQGTWEKTTEA